MNTHKVTEQSKNLQQPNDHYNHNNYVEYILDFKIHRDHIIDKPQNETCNNYYE